MHKIILSFLLCATFAHPVAVQLHVMQLNGNLLVLIGDYHVDFIDFRATLQQQQDIINFMKQLGPDALLILEDMWDYQGDNETIKKTIQKWKDGSWWGEKFGGVVTTFKNVTDDIVMMEGLTEKATKAGVNTINVDRRHAIWISRVEGTVPASAAIEEMDSMIKELQEYRDDDKLLMNSYAEIISFTDPGTLIQTVAKDKNEAKWAVHYDIVAYEPYAQQMIQFLASLRTTPTLSIKEIAKQKSKELDKAIHETVFVAAVSDSTMHLLDGRVLHIAHAHKGPIVIVAGTAHTDFLVDVYKKMGAQLLYMAGYDPLPNQSAIYIAQRALDLKKSLADGLKAYKEAQQKTKPTAQPEQRMEAETKTKSAQASHKKKNLHQLS